MATFGNPIVASPNLLPSTAEVFNASKSGGYGAGEYVYREGKLYKFTAAHTGAWTGTDVEEIKLADEVAALNEDLDAFKENVGENYARIDGYYDELTAGNAEQLIATVGVDDNAPYLFRTTGGSADVGDRKTMELVGGTVAWNQLLQNGDFSDGTTGWGTGFGTGALSDGVFTVTPSNDDTRARAETPFFRPAAAHKYLCVAVVKGNAGSKYRMSWYGTDARDGYYTGNWQIISNIYNHGNNIQNWRVYVGNWDVVADVSFKSVVIIDLTQMFGSTIADYIYTLETATTGDGVAWFRKYFPKDYYAYDAGTLMSVKTSANITTGFNQWDEEWELGGINSNGQNTGSSTNIRSKNYIPIVGGASYYCSSSFEQISTIWCCVYDADKNLLQDVFPDGWWHYINRRVTVMPENAKYMRFVAPTTTYNHDICINLSWDGERDGEYEPYVSHEYAIDSDLELRGIPKLNADNALYYDGDVYTSDGTVTRRFGAVDLGTLTWRSSGDNLFYATGSANPSIDGFMPYNRSTVANAVCVKYIIVAQTDLADKCLSIHKSDQLYVSISDSTFNNDPAALQDALNGVYLVCELAVSTVEQADSFTSPETVDDFGTEQFVDTRDVPIPVGHNSVYQANLRAKLEMAPDSPDGDGDYIVRQSNGTNAYVPYILPTAGDVNFDVSAEYDDGTVGAELNKKADVDGYYETLTSGLAENLIATVGVEDSVPYNFRTTGGSADVGDRKEMEIVGGTIAWNQFVPIPTGSISKTSNGVTFVDNRDGSYTVSTADGGATANEYIAIASTSVPSAITGHVYLFSGTPAGGSDSTYRSYAVTTAFTQKFDYGSGYIAKATSSAAVTIVPAYIFNGAVITTAVTFRPQFFDLTQMFGSTIADYIYSLETANAGAGAAWFRKLFPKPYYAYDAGTLMSVKTSANVTTGFNACGSALEYGNINASGQEIAGQNYVRTDEYIPVAAGMKYCFYAQGTEQFMQMYVLEYDAAKNILSRTQLVGGSTLVSSADATKILGSETHYVRMFVYRSSNFTSPSNLQFCINLSWDGERDGEYEPYIARTYALDPDLELNGFPRLDADNQLYYDGDTYEADGTVTRNYAIFDLGDLAWTKYTTQAPVRFHAKIEGGLVPSSSPSGTGIGLVSKDYDVVPRGTTGGNAYDKSVLLGSSFASGASYSVVVRDDSKADLSQTQFKSAVAGIKILCQMLPTTETADPFTTPQIVDDFGTEEFIDAGVTADPPTRDVAIPVGHNTVYAANLRAKLEMAPDSPDGDGDYIVRQVSGINTYVPITFPADELPAAPTTDGTYVLKVTVADGTATYSWVSAT